MQALGEYPQGAIGLIALNDFMDLDHGESGGREDDDSAADGVDTE